MQVESDDGRVGVAVRERTGSDITDSDPEETHEWLDSLDSVVHVRGGRERAQFILNQLLRRAQALQIGVPAPTDTAYVNTISPAQEPWFPGDEATELRIERLIRWNAVMLVLRANIASPGIGGHLATYASASTLYEVAFNHFLRGKGAPHLGDQVFFQAHAAPGIYARAFLEGRLTVSHLDHFRREVESSVGLSSYPHPRLMPDFWEFPCASMGLGPLAAAYQARFNRYLHDRNLKDTSDNHVWAFVGDGEMDEPESLAAVSVAGREALDNLTLVVNCNLQRLDGPVRGNSKLIQELESLFRGAGWNVIKVIWSHEWDDLLARDADGRLVEKMNETLDGDFQKYSIEPGAYIRRRFFGPDEALAALVAHLSDDEIKGLRRGGHDPKKLYAAYAAAMACNDRPTAILAKTVKGWLLGPSVEARNAAHQAKRLSANELKALRDTLALDIPDENLADLPYYHPGSGAPEIEYMRERRAALGGSVPNRVVTKRSLALPAESCWAEFKTGSGGRDVSTTMAFAKLLRNLLHDGGVGARVVPIIPDEARTFGMDAIFGDVGIYSGVGQLYEPVDSQMILRYREAMDGQILQEGISEAGAAAAFQAAATSYATHAEPVIPFYIFYSMFGFQRTGDEFWAIGDARGRGFLMGATAGRTTLNGEGLQHEDGQSLLLASTIPCVRAYDPAFAYEVAIIVCDGLRRMYREMEDIFYYLTLYNESYPMPAMPDQAGVEEGAILGLYRFRPALRGHSAAVGGGRGHGPLRATLIGSGSIMRQALGAQELLAERFGVSAEVWSATSYQLLRKEALEAEWWSRLHPHEAPRVPRVTQLLREPAEAGPIVAATDYMTAVPDQVARWVPGNSWVSLGTDGFGRSDTREVLRRFFGVDAEHIAASVLSELARTGRIPPGPAADAIRELVVDVDQLHPLRAARPGHLPALPRIGSSTAVGTD